MKSFVARVVCSEDQIYKTLLVKTIQSHLDGDGQFLRDLPVDIRVKWQVI